MRLRRPVVTAAVALLVLIVAGCGAAAVQVWVIGTEQDGGISADRVTAPAPGAHSAPASASPPAPALVPSQAAGA